MAWDRAVEQAKHWVLGDLYLVLTLPPIACSIWTCHCSVYVLTTSAKRGGSPQNFCVHILEHVDNHFPLHWRMMCRPVLLLDVHVVSGCPQIIPFDDHSRIILGKTVLPTLSTCVLGSFTTSNPVQPGYPHATVTGIKPWACGPI